jgi:hypothetical protein
MVFNIDALEVQFDSEDPRNPNMPNTFDSVFAAFRTDEISVISPFQIFEDFEEVNEDPAQEFFKCLQDLYFSINENRDEEFKLENIDFHKLRQIVMDTFVKMFNEDEIIDYEFYLRLYYLLVDRGDDEVEVQTETANSVMQIYELFLKWEKESNILAKIHPKGFVSLPEFFEIMVYRI